MSGSLLSDFIRSNLEPILGEWEAFARTCQPAAEGMNVASLRDHGVQLLNWIAADLETFQTNRQEEDKGKGLARAKFVESVATLHGELRYQDQFTLTQVVAEFRALRASVIRLWINDKGVVGDAQIEDLIRFNEAIDEAVAESVARFSASLEEARDMFTAMLGHDLRNPLAAIVTGASYLQASMPAQSQAGAVSSQILESGHRMRRLIADILDFSQIRLCGEIPIVPGDMNMEEVCREVVEEIKVAHPETVFKIERIGKVSGRWDRERVGQVISNLVSNGLQHGAKDRSITINILGEDTEVLLTVHNWGPVISSRDMATIFEPTKRINTDAQDSKYKGSLGLGLHIVRLIVNAHGGTIEVESTKEKGTTFTVHWPRNFPTPTASRAHVEKGLKQ